MSDPLEPSAEYLKKFVEHHMKDENLGVDRDSDPPGYFRPKFFGRLPTSGRFGGWRGSQFVAAVANAWDEKRWACSQGGTHRLLSTYGEDPEIYGPAEGHCEKCGAKVRVRLETV